LRIETSRHGISALIEKMSQTLGGEPQDWERKAWGILTMMVGAVSIAQALPAGDEANKALEAAPETAISVVNGQDQQS
jgi:choline-glycine betaine transporter